MAIARGANTKLAFKFESVYGTNPGGTDFLQLPFSTLDLGDSQNLIESNVIGIGTGRDPADPFYDAVDVSGSADVPLDKTEFARWLKMLMGAPTTTGSTNYVHTFKSGSASGLPSATIEKGLGDISRYELFTGVRAGSLEITAGATGRPSAKIGLMGKLKAVSGSPVDASLTAPASYEQYNNFQATLTRGGSALGYVTNCRLSFSNNLEAVRSIGDGTGISEAVEGDTQTQVNLSVRVANTTLLDDADGSSPIALVLTYTISATKLIEFTVPRLFVPRARTQISGRQGVQVDFAARAAYDATEACALKVVVKNQTATY